MNWDYLMRIAYCDNISVLKLTERLCKDAVANGIEGDFAEAGVAYGAHGIIMKSNSKDKKVYLFDSFEGIPKHGEYDPEFQQSYGASEGNQRESSGITVCPLYAVKETIMRETDLDRFVFREGWFIDTFPKLTDEKFSVLRLDCDLYESHMLCFEYLLPRLSKGGWLIIDDWVLSGCKRAIAEYGLDQKTYQVENNIFYLQID